MRTRKICAVMICALALVLPGCGKASQDVAQQAKREEDPYPEAEAVMAALEETGFEVEKSDSFEELGIPVTRITAVNGEEYLDLCYDIGSADDQDQIVAYYTSTEDYRNYNLVSDGDIVYCYSSESVLESAGLQ